MVTVMCASWYQWTAISDTTWCRVSHRFITISTSMRSARSVRRTSRPCTSAGPCRAAAIERMVSYTLIRTSTISSSPISRGRRRRGRGRGSSRSARSRPGRVLNVRTAQPTNPARPPSAGAGLACCRWSRSMARSYISSVRRSTSGQVTGGGTVRL